MSIEADIHALANNPNGYPEGAWVPFLQIRYELTKLPAGEKFTGDFMGEPCSPISKSTA